MSGSRHAAAGCPWQNQWVQIGVLGPFEVRTDDGVLADVPGPGCVRC
jgi:hypothetical protein